MTTDAATLRADLHADCSRCVGLCCVGLAFARSADFPVDKPAGTPCLNLAADDTCRIHDRLRSSGWRGCTVFDCLGAGQRVTAAFGGASWRDDAGTAEAMFAAFGAMRRLHELLWFLADAVGRDVTAELRGEAERLLVSTRAATELDGEALLAFDVTAHSSAVGRVLALVSEAVRGRRGPQAARVERRGRDLVGASLAGLDLRGVLLRGALLVAADLRGTDLRLADLAGADLRDADLSGADLRGALYVTQPQLDAAHGDAAARLPDGVRRPTHWP